MFEAEVDMVRRVTITAGTLLLLLAGLLPHSHARAAHLGGGDPHRCYNIQLLIRLYYNPGGAAGHVSLIYGIHDLWSGSCVLRGYPGLQLLDHNFHSMPTYLSRSQGSLIATIPVRRVTLDLSSDAYFVASYHDIQIESETCKDSPYLMITPPHDNLPIVTFSRVDDSPSYFEACGGDVTVSPVASKSELPVAANPHTKLMSDENYH
jgi:Protein of unknown function (DUF4232)